MERRIDDIDWALLDRYAAREASAEEIARVESWAGDDPARRALLQAMRRPAAAADDWDVALAWSTVQSRAANGDAHDRATDPPARPPSAATRAVHRRAVAPLLLRAAAIVVVLGAAVVAARALLQRDGAAPAELIVVATARSESDTVRLDDGSVVILAAQSRLDYPRSFGATSRAVQLAGEALFRVAPDSSRPFTVRAGDAVIRVVGTEFAVRSQRAAATDTAVIDAVTVAVAEGVVAVRAAGAADREDVVVRSGEVARVTRDGPPTVASAPDLDRYFGWVDGRLIFDDALLADVLAELQRWYPLEFRADSTLTGWRVTARLRARSLDETVDALALALGAGHRRNGDTIFFSITPNSNIR